MTQVQAAVRERIDAALGSMSRVGPRDLRGYLAKPTPDFVQATSSDVEAMLQVVLGDNPNDESRLLFSQLMRGWDNARDAAWLGGTPRNSAARRLRIHELLKSGSDLASHIDKIVPFFLLEEPLLIAREHKPWYRSLSGRDYYWTTYMRYLRDKRGLPPDAVLALENDTAAVVECLANPESAEAYSARGLVMGYVQSGKTANFMGVVSRAADAGYRLFIVLAGTWNILRNQTQRRFDKELLGKQLLANDEGYRNTPADWDEFLDHGVDPVEAGQYAWQRITRPEIDLRRLNAAIESLEFERRNKALPLYHPENLHGLPAKLLVIKKHSRIVGGLVKDLKLLRTKLATLPALVIDDESDQAGLNTVDPRKVPKPGKERTSTNKAIVELLEVLPRAQYVGYTATPYANAFVDPNDPKDLFPKDFVLPLARPRQYMGVSDFFDPLVSYGDLEPTDFAEAEVAFIRRVERPVDGDDEDLSSALTCFVLSGAIKLFRMRTDPLRYRKELFKHHTMLIHTSSARGAHASIAERVAALWDRCALNTAPGKRTLRDLWEQDYSKVSARQGDEVVPSSFDELVPSIAEALSRIQASGHLVRVVNSDSDEAPDFGEGPVWSIIIGGNKLSRGYTVEGLTVSYYRRVSSNADTLMQMGRWFGFRPGYRDLVRVFLGVREGKGRDVDLVALFKEVCVMEDRFHSEIGRYRVQPGVERILPEHVPPLVYVTGNIPPTARNKMFHATLSEKNFGGQWSQPTLTALDEKNCEANVRGVGTLLGTATVNRGDLGGKCGNGARINEAMVFWQVPNDALIAFLREFRWLEAEYERGERPSEIQLQIEFLERPGHGIESWLVLAPQQKKTSFGKVLPIRDGGSLTVKKRSRVGGRGFEVVGEPKHRSIAEYVAAVPAGKGKQDNGRRLVEANPSTARLRGSTRGCLLLYPVRPTVDGVLSIGFELLFPGNELPRGLYFTVKKAAARQL